MFGLTVFETTVNELDSTASMSFECPLDDTDFECSKGRNQSTFLSRYSLQLKPLGLKELKTFLGYFPLFHYLVRNIFSNGFCNRALGTSSTTDVRISTCMKNVEFCCYISERSSRRGTLRLCWRNVTIQVQIFHQVLENGYPITVRLNKISYLEVRGPWTTQISLSRSRTQLVPRHSQNTSTQSLVRMFCWNVKRHVLWELN